MGLSHIILAAFWIGNTNSKRELFFELIVYPVDIFCRILLFHIEGYSPSANLSYYSCKKFNSFGQILFPEYYIYREKRIKSGGNTL